MHLVAVAVLERRLDNLDLEVVLGLHGHQPLVVECGAQLIAAPRECAGESAAVAAAAGQAAAHQSDEACATS